MQITDDIKQTIRERIDIVDLIGEVVELKRRGSNYVGLCPFHNEKTPSFAVSEGKAIYKCFGCGAAGNVISFMTDYHGLSFPDAIKELARRCGINLEYDIKPEELSKKDLIFKALEEAKNLFKKNLFSAQGKHCLTYYKKRGFTDDTINAFELGYSPDSWQACSDALMKIGFTKPILIEAGLMKLNEENQSTYDFFRNRAIFPIHNFMGKVIGFGGRLLIDDQQQAKYINSPQSIVYDKSQVIYGIFQAKNEIRSKKTALLVEGYADVISLHQAGYKNTIASSGTALTSQQIKSLTRFANKLFLIYDSDTAGQNAAEKAIAPSLELGFELKVVNLPKGDDPDSLIKEQGNKVFDSYLADANNFIEFLLNRDEMLSKLDSPMDISNFIYKCVKLIAKIPDRMQHDFYIQILSSKLSLTNAQLKKIYLEKKKYETENSNSTNTTSRNEQAREQKESLDEQPKQIEKFDDKNILPEEKLLLKLFLANEEARKSILYKKRLSSESFYSSDAAYLFDILHSVSKKNQDPIFSLAIDEGSVPKQIKDYLIGLSLDGEQASDNWQKFGGETLDDNIKKNLKDAIAKLEIRKIDAQLAKIKQTLKEVPFSEAKELFTEQQKLISKRQVLIETLNFVKI